MIRTRGQYRNGQIELDKPIDVPDGTFVEVSVYADVELADDEWRELGMQRLEEEWESSQDAAYDDWRRLYGVPQP